MSEAPVVGRDLLLHSRGNMVAFTLLFGTTALLASFTVPGHPRPPQPTIGLKT